uniref:Apple domain-containing protein n=1 Tax=Tetranychus urticae TaxID=32264 RepID=T1K0C2_TETUR
MPIDLPLDIEDGNWLIKAKLTDESDSSVQIKVDEYIQSKNGTIRGKIVAKIGKEDPMDIFYTDAKHYERLRVRDPLCDHFLYKNKEGWDRFLDGVEKDNFANHLILVGPSVIFRINKLSPVWTSGQDVVIRGFKQHSATFSLDPTLNVWFYYNGNSLEGLKRPTRALFSGYDHKSYVRTEGRFWYDLYTITRIDQNFDTIVTVSNVMNACAPEPGLVCTQYFNYTSTSIPFPKLTQHALHFIVKAKDLNAGPEKKEEVYADEKNQILRSKSATYGKDNKLITTDIIYDYQLGLEYEFTDEGKCSVSPMSLSAPGLVQDSSLTYGNYKLDLNRLLNFDLNYRYLGPALFGDRDEIGIHAWEILNKGAELGGQSYPNVVTTQYFSELTDGRTDYTLVGTTKKAYDSNRQDILGLILKLSSMSSSDSMEKFSVRDCYADPKAQKTIAFFFTCTDIPCDYFNQYYYQMQDKVKEALVNIGTISASRIANIEPIIGSKEIITYVTILDFPGIKSKDKMQNMKLAEDTLATSSSVMIDEEACLRTNSYKYEPFTAIAFYKTENGNVCQRIDGKKVKLIEDENNGMPCSVFMTPLKNIYRYSRELPLENIHEKLAHIEISLVSPNNNAMFTLTPYQVKDVTKVNDNLTNSIYENIIQNTKLMEDKLNTIQVFGTIDLSSCHRKCVQSAENSCRSFSFCTYADRVECFVSTISNVSSEKITHEASCGTYLIENLTKFKKISLKKFNNIEKSVAFESSLGKCASLCSNSESCKSFQFCSGSCSLAGYYTDESSVYSESCDIYFPKVLDRFELTGKWIVADVFHTELNLNADECAALCFQWNDYDTVCQSFNFCPAHGKTSSMCHLSKYSRHDANEKLIHSDTCQNYERTKQSENEQRNTEIISKVTHSGQVYGIIVLFVTTGLVSGIVVAMVYLKFFSVKSDATQIYNRNTFSWSKQLNDERQSVNGEGSLQISSDYAVPVSE